MRADSRPVRGGPWYLFSNTSFESCTAPCPHLGAARTAEMRRLRWVRAGRKSLRRLNHKWNPASPQNPHHTVLRARPRHPKSLQNHKSVQNGQRSWKGMAPRWKHRNCIRTPSSSTTSLSHSLLFSFNQFHKYSISYQVLYTGMYPEPKSWLEWP